jgi:pimeloyl-ACP methyl ester carboxylesterase
VGIESVPLLDGNPPPSPQWFSAALANVPERRWIKVRGVDVEMLTWGEAGNPGLLFLHGKGAHADWWSFIAPFFSADFRVVAISWSGMGRSGWREAYPEQILAEEALAALEESGSFTSSVRPIVVAHSFGSRIAIELCRHNADRLRSVVLVDPPLHSVESAARRRQLWISSAPKVHRIYPSVEEALRRYRFAPYQSCDNLFIADFIARRSLTRVDDAGEQGWRWCFDPRHWAPDRWNAIHELPSGGGAPFAIVLGSRSALYTRDDVSYITQMCLSGTALVSIPEAAHHVMVDQPIALVSVLRTLFAGLPRA